MASTNSKKIGVDLDFSSGAKLKNLPASAVGGEAVEHNELNTKLSLKQDVISGGSGIEVEGNVVNVDLATAGSDYSTFVVTDAAYSSLEGEYIRASYQAYVDYAGTNLDLTYGGDFNLYYKDNGNGIWAVIVQREIDGDVDTDDLGSWLMCLVTVDPSSISSNYSSFIPNYQAVDYDTIADADVQDENGKISPAEGGYGFNSDASYGTGSTPAGLLFDNNKLALDFASNVSSASSTKVFPSSVIKTYTDEQVALAKDLSNHPFNNAVAQITGNPNNAQSMGEALASEIDTLDGQVSSLQTKDVTHDAYIEDHRLALGIPQGQDALSAFTGAAAAFTAGATTVQSVAQNLGTAIGDVYSNVGGLLGLGQFDTDFGDGFTILPNNEDAKALFQATETELQNISLGLGQFWSPVEAHEYGNVNISNPGTDTFGGAVVSATDRVLLLGQTDASENGIYLFTTSGTAMTRALDANEDTEFSPNKTVQVLNSTEDGISGATFSYTGADDPVVGTDDLTFALKSKGVVGDSSITEGKLALALALKLNNKTDKYAETVTLAAGTPLNITHGLNSQDVVVQVRDTSGNVTDVEIDITDSSYVTINSLYAGDYRVVVIG